MTEDESLQRYGLQPAAGDLDQVRRILQEQAALERRRQGDGDTALMKLCCVQLFNAGLPDDTPAIWHAKESSWDAHCSIDVQLLCGAGLEQTKRYLTAGLGATDALDYLLECEAAGDFMDFSPDKQSRIYSAYYQG
jgi:hypothetical protein